MLTAKRIFGSFVKSVWIGVLPCLFGVFLMGCQDSRDGDSKAASISNSTNSQTRESDLPKSGSPESNANAKRSDGQGLQESSESEADGNEPAGDPQTLNWPAFRGPEFRSETADPMPTKWAMDEGIKWKQGLPGRGASTPVIFGEQIFVTAYDGFGLSLEQAGKFEDLVHHLMCFNKSDGRPVWHRKISGTSLKQKVNTELVRHGFASSTPVTDGENVYAYFGVTGVFAFDKNGKQLWQRNLGLDTHYFGSSASPILFDDLLIVNASIESKTIYALNKTTGAVEWKIDRVNECWSTPVIGKNEDGEYEMIVSSKNMVNAYNPSTGADLWHCPGIMDYVVSVPIIVDGIVYLTGGKQKQTMAIRMGGQGDATKNKLWEIPKIGSNVSSPVYKDGMLFIFHENYLSQVIDAKNGTVLKRSRTATSERPFSSPLIAGDYLYMPFQDAGVAVFNANAEFEEVTVNPDPDGLALMASLVPSDGCFYSRNDRYLFCISGLKGKTVSTEWSDNKPESELVDVIESYNIDPEKGWSRRYMGFIRPNFEQAIKFLLMPYQSVITDEQTVKAREIVLGEKPKYDSVREQFEKVQWEELTSPATESARFHAEYSKIEEQTKKLNHETRILVKKLFPKEQMEQHLEDAKAGIAHKKPGESKQ